MLSGTSSSSEGFYQPPSEAGHGFLLVSSSCACMANAGPGGPARAVIGEPLRVSPGLSHRLGARPLGVNPAESSAWTTYRALRLGLLICKTE